MSKVRLTTYTFDASAKTVLATQFSDVGLAGIQLIANVTDGIVIYNFADPAKGGTLSTDTLTLDYDTTSMSDTDELMILCEDGNNNAQAIQDAVESIDLDTASILAAVDGLETNTASTNTKLDTLITATDGVETLLGTIDADTSALAGAVAGSEVQVDVVAALPAGNNNIGDVDVATLPGVQFQDVYVTGQGSQTAINQNIILASAGSTAYDTLNGTTGISFRSVSIQVVPASGTVTAGTVVFEGSNDNTNFVAVFLSDSANITALPVSTYTLAANISRYFIGAIPFRYFRARLSVGITGTTTGVQAFSVFSTVPYSSPRLSVSNATAANLAVTSTASGNTAVTMAANATTTPAKARDGVAGATDTGIPAFAIRDDVLATLTAADGDWEPTKVDSTGALWTRDTATQVDDAAFTPATGRVLPAAFLADETATDSVDEGDAGIARMTLDRRIITAGQKLDDAAMGIGTDYVTPVGMLADETSSDSVDEGDLGVPRMTLDRKAIATLYPSTGTTDGLSVANFNTGDTYTALTNSAQAIKASAGNLYGYYIYNPNASAVYVSVYNIAAGSVTVGTSTQAMVFCIPASSGANLMFPYPIPFTTAMSAAATTTGGGNTAPGTALEVMFFYR